MPASTRSDTGSAAIPPLVHDFGPLDAAIHDSLQLCVPDVIAQAHASNKHLYVLALGFVDDLTGFFVAGATLQWAASLGPPQQDNTDYYWFPSEWDLQSELHLKDRPSIYAVLEQLQEACDDRGEEFGEEVGEEEYSKLRREYEQRTVAQLKAMRAEGALRDESGREIWVWCHYADAFDEDFDDRSFADINDTETTRRFKDRFEKGKDSLTSDLMREIEPVWRELGCPEGSDNDDDDDNDGRGDIDHDSDNDDSDGQEGNGA